MRNLSDAEVAFLRNNIAKLSTRKLAEKFSEQFSPIGQTQLRRMLAKYHISNPRKENKMLPVGTEKYSSYYDCIQIKVEEISVAGISNDKTKNKLRNKQWQLKQNYVWEKTHNRKLKYREIVIFLDGDRTNYDPDNLFAVDLNVAGTIEKMGMHSENSEIYKTALIWGQLYYALQKSGFSCQEFFKSID